MEDLPGNWNYFAPPRRSGLLIDMGGLLLTFALAAFLLSSALSRQPGLPVILMLLGALLLSLPIPILLYRLYGLVQSAYWVGRDGVRLRWGLRLVDLPYNDIVDVARVDELAEPVKLPEWTWPGSVVGTTIDAELGNMEFLAADAGKLVLLGTRNGVIAISPEAPQAFVAAYKRQSERGSLRPIQARSVAPSFVLAEAWAQPGVSRLLVTGAGLALGLLVLVGILAPGLQSISLGFGGNGLPLEPVAGVQLFLLPVLNLFFYMGCFVLGLLFYREVNGMRFSTLVWGSSLVASTLFLVAILSSLFLST